MDVIFEIRLSKVVASILDALSWMIPLSWISLFYVCYVKQIGNWIKEKPASCHVVSIPVEQPMWGGNEGSSQIPVRNRPASKHVRGFGSGLDTPFEP